MEIIDVSERVEFADKFMPRILKAGASYKVPLICLEELAKRYHRMLRATVSFTSLAGRV